MSPNDAKSIRSKRSLSISVNSVSKIIKMNNDGANAISKVKGQRNDLFTRHKSTERAVSRGRANIFTRNPRVEAGKYLASQRDFQSNSLEDLKSHISRASFHKEAALNLKNQSLTPARNA